MELAIQKLIALSCFVIGLSHILQPRAWAQLFIGWRERGDAGVFYTGLLHFTFGALIVAFHSVWSGLPLLVTLLGWAWTLKGVIYLCYPALGRRMLARVSVERAYEFTIAGAVLVLIALVLAWHLFARA
ncbi:hypothetical protein BH20VER1_BH20VER1_27410 [soil metagenome]